MSGRSKSTVGNIRSRLFAQCGEPTSVDNEDGFKMNLGALIERLLLFDTYILRSVRLQEIPALIESFGYDATIELLQSNAIELHSDIIPVGSVPISPKEAGRFSFKIITIQFDQALTLDFDRNRRTLGLPQDKLLLLEETLARKVRNYPKDSYKEIQSQFTNDLKNNATNIRTALSISLEKKLQREVEAEELELTIQASSMQDVRIETNLKHLYGLNDDEADEVISAALFSIGGLNERILQMKTYNALTGFNETELPVFGDKLKFLEESLSPDSSSRSLHRVLTIKDFPDLGEAAKAGEINLIKLLEIRECDEIRDFRNWLLTIDQTSERELNEMISSFKSSLSSAFNCKIGKTIRWLASNAAGFVPPPYGLGVGPALSGLDLFLSTKVFPERGALSFIDNIFPTIFENS